jgi:hypothetical protein
VVVLCAYSTREKHRETLFWAEGAGARAMQGAARLDIKNHGHSSGPAGCSLFFPEGYYPRNRLTGARAVVYTGFFAAGVVPFSGHIRIPLKWLMRTASARVYLQTSLHPTRKLLSKGKTEIWRNFSHPHSFALTPRVGPFLPLAFVIP